MATVQRERKESTRRGSRKKEGPAHQNKYAFRHNKCSRLTRKIAAIPNVGLCAKCSEIVEWRKKYRKYKPLKHPAACTQCHNRNVMYAYHNLCKPCATARSCCPKCFTTEMDNADDEDSTPIERALDALLDDPRVKERQKRALVRKWEREELTAADIERCRNLSGVETPEGEELDDGLSDDGEGDDDFYDSDGEGDDEGDEDSGDEQVEAKRKPAPTPTKSTPVKAAPKPAGAAGAAAGGGAAAATATPPAKKLSAIQRTALLTDSLGRKAGASPSPATAAVAATASPSKPAAVSAASSSSSTTISSPAKAAPVPPAAAKKAQPKQEGDDHEEDGEGDDEGDDEGDEDEEEEEEDGDEKKGADDEAGFVAGGDDDVDSWIKQKEEPPASAVAAAATPTKAAPAPVPAAAAAAAPAAASSNSAPASAAAVGVSSAAAIPRAPLDPSAAAGGVAAVSAFVPLGTQVPTGRAAFKLGANQRKSGAAPRR